MILLISGGHCILAKVEYSLFKVISIFNQKRIYYITLDAFKVGQLVKYPKTIQKFMIQIIAE